MSPTIPRRELRPGYTISRLIKGGWQLAGGHGSVERDRAIDDMIAFVDAGITTFDCADIYTGVEEMIGAFRSRLSDKRGAQTLAGIKIHTKCVPDLEVLPRVDFAYMELVIDRSLNRLGMERLDLVQTYWWDLNVPGAEAALGHLQTLQKAGKIDNIGLTNYGLDQSRQMAATGVDLMSTQVQFSLLDNRPEGQFADWCADNRIHLLCYGGLAGGFLTDFWLGKPDPGYTFQNRSLVKYRLIIDEFGGWDLFQELMHTLAQIARRLDVALSAIALRAMLERNDVAAMIVGARYAHHLPQTLQAFKGNLSCDDRARIDAVLARRAGPQGDIYDLESRKDGRHGKIMKYNLNS